MKKKLGPEWSERERPAGARAGRAWEKFFGDPQQPDRSASRAFGAGTTAIRLRTRWCYGKKAYLELADFRDLVLVSTPMDKEAHHE